MQHKSKLTVTQFDLIIYLLIKFTTCGFEYNNIKVMLCNSAIYIYALKMTD